MREVVKSLLEKTLEVENIVIEIPKIRSHGHFSTPLAFELAKKLKKSPQEIAKQILSKVEQLDIFSHVECIHGYINFTLSTQFLDLQCQRLIQSPNNLTSTNLDHQAQKDILIEYVSANPTGPLHVGHARGAVFGDTLARLGRYLGYGVSTEYYINDAGAQIHILGNSILLAGLQHILKKEVVYPEQYYHGEYILEIAKMAHEKFGLKVFIEEDIQKLGDFGKDIMMNEIIQNLSMIGISFDRFISERSLYPQWQQTLSKLQDNGGVYVKDGKTWLSSHKLGDEKDRVVVRENGEPTYMAGDIIYHWDKFKRGYKRYINVWGADHHGYIPRIKASLSFLNQDPDILEIILVQMVSLLKEGQPYKMSKRAGNFLLLKDLVEDIGVDALRFIFLSKKLDTPLEFDTSNIQKQDQNNPVFYINYANARIHTLLQKVHDFNLSCDLSSLKGANKDLQEDALDLLFLALEIQDVLKKAFKERAIHRICDYLRELAGLFHKFYNAHRIIDSPQEKALLKILSTVSHSLTLGLSLLGIQAKTKM